MALFAATARHMSTAPWLAMKLGATPCRARKELAGIFSKVIQGRRAAGRSEHDLLQHFMDCRYKVAYGGRATTDEEISGMLIASLFAGQHTSSITSAWTGFFMLADKVGFPLFYFPEVVIHSSARNPPLSKEHQTCCALGSRDS